MGGIDLDPASCAAANLIVKATRYYTQEQNGLALPWHGNIWLNPPYGRSAKMQGQHKSTIGLFIEKCLTSYTAGHVTQAIILATTEVNAKWFYPLWHYPICIPDHRVSFLVPIKQENNYKQMFGTCFVYLGPRIPQFIDVFSEFGHIVQSVAAPRRCMPVTTELWQEVGA
jgi:ParB family chromosome partitioning protein